MELTVFDLEKTAMERWRNGDPHGFVEISAQDICYVDPGLTKPVIGLDEYGKYMQQVEGKIHYHRSEFIDPIIVDAGDAMLLTYNYRSTVLTPEGAISSQTPWNTTEVYYKQKIIHSHWSFIRHRMPEVVEVPLILRPAPVRSEGILGELMALESSAMDRWRKGDPWGFVELYSPGVTYFDTGTPQRINGREAMIAEYKLREGKIFYEVMDFIEPWVFACDDLAVLFYRFLSTHLNPDGSVASRTPWNCTEVYQRMDGSWKIIHNHWSLIRGERY